MSNHVRLACDRCRASKLRCPRAEAPQNNACDRCRRAGVSCITSSARPLGRPRTKRPAREASVPTARRQEHQAHDSTDLQIAPIGATHATYVLGENMPISSSDLPNGPTWLGTASNHSYDVIDSLTPTNMDHFLNFHDPTLDELLRQGLDTPTENMYADLARMPPGSESLSPLRAHQTDAIMKLSQLNESIARHKTNAEAYPIYIPPDLRICAETSDDFERNPVVQALQSASEFCAILEWLMLDPTCSSSTTLATPCNSSSSRSEDSDPGSTPSDAVSASQGNGYPFSKPIMLLLLSSYLQIIELYSYIFGRVCQLLQQIPDTPDFFQRSPKFRVNGIPPMKAQLYVRFMVQATADDFRSIEHLMGLPQEFCTSPHDVSSKGIFSGADSLSLLQLVLGQTGRGCEKDSVTSLVALLREKFQLLDTLLSR